MKLSRILDWFDTALDTAAFDDVSNNGLQIARSGEEIRSVAFAVDASVASVRAAAGAGADLLVVHHGISWGGGVKRLAGGVYNVVRAAMEADLALAAYHLPLDASEKYGNNFNLARYLGLRRLRRAFAYRGSLIGVIGENPQGRLVGVCSGGGGAFAEEAQRLGCELYVTGEADWGERIAAENAGVKMITAGHYETETFGVRALADGVRRALKLPTCFVGAAVPVGRGLEIRRAIA